MHNFIFFKFLNALKTRLQLRALFKQRSSWLSYWSTISYQSSKCWSQMITKFNFYYFHYINQKNYNLIFCRNITHRSKYKQHNKRSRKVQFSNYNCDNLLRLTNIYLSKRVLSLSSDAKCLFLQVAKFIVRVVCKQ